MLVALRTDASATIGTGHLRRCISLAGELRTREGVDVAFVCRQLGLEYSPLSTRGMTAHLLPRPSTGEMIETTQCRHAAWAQVDWQRDAEETIALLHGNPVGALVVDHYAFDAAWHEHMRESLRCPILAIDDLGDRDMAVDLLLDQNYARNHASKYGSRIRSTTRILGGPSFALLDAAYSRQPPYVFSDIVRSIGIFMGGVDLHHSSELALEAIAMAGFSGPVEIVTTRSNPTVPMIEAAASRRPNTVVTTDLPHLAAFFSRHDLQIGAGGSATWERCCMGAPALTLALAENQEHLLGPLADIEVSATLPSGSGVERVAREISLLLQQPGRRRTLSTRSRQLVDGRGAARVADALLGICDADDN